MYNLVMGLKEFPGILDGISPGLLINKNKKDDMQSFFLILGSIFNDLKGLIFFQKFIEENYRRPGPDEVSAHAGEYNGLMAYVDKLLIATIGEFFVFIDKNKSITSSISFLLLLKNLDSKNKNNWIDLVKLNEGSSVLSKIARVRSNVVFHYDHSMEEIRKGFIMAFFTDRKKVAQHKKAYLSLGDNMRETRIYYSDAAVSDYISSLIDNIDRNEIWKAMDNMNHTIQGLLRVYLGSIK